MPKFDLEIKEGHDVDSIEVDHLSRLSTQFYTPIFFLLRKF